MARTEITRQTANSSGLQVSWTNAITDGHKALWDNQSKLLIKNGATTFNLILKANRMIDGLVLPDKTIAIAANKEYVIEDLPLDVYLQADSMLYWDYSNTTTGQVAVVT